MLNDALNNMLVIVESPNKTSSISGYLKKLGYKNCKVLASYGHISNLIPKQSAIDTENNFQMQWEQNAKSQKHLEQIIEQARVSEKLIIATDPDREGEAIGWHIIRNLEEHNIRIPVKRMIFHSITIDAIKKGMDNLIEIRMDLVQAYKTRLGLDFLVGFYISPILWRKLPGCMSAGRVQSAALRLIVELEYQRVQFIPKEYYAIKAYFSNQIKDQSPVLITNLNQVKKDDKFKQNWEESQRSSSFKAQLHSIQGIKLERNCLYETSPEQLHEILNKLSNQPYTIIDKQIKHKSQSPSAPFITSTLQQEASNVLNFSPAYTMKLAQGLYEGVDVSGSSSKTAQRTGLITYMRTDNVHLSTQALDECRDFINRSFGEKYLHPVARIHKSKVRNAQEAHECIRPTNFQLTPQILKDVLDDTAWKLYDLIWKRAVASQMSDAQYEETNIIISNQYANFKCTGNVQLFDGYTLLYKKKEDELLPLLSVGQQLNLQEVTHEQKQTQPPHRLTAASLISNMEKLGIGRPSTYTSIIDKLQEREYITNEQGQLVPTQRSWFLIAFLKRHFGKYVEYEFTASLEEQLDEISQGQQGWLDVLTHFWHDFKPKVDQGKEILHSVIKDEVGQEWKSFFFSENNKGEYDDKCSECGALAQVQIYQGSAFIACSRYPDCSWKKSLNSGAEAKTIGIDPKTGQEIELRTGKYGAYFQWKLIDSSLDSKSNSINSDLLSNPQTAPGTLELSLQQTTKERTHDQATTQARTSKQKSVKAQKEIQIKRVAVPSMFSKHEPTVELAIALSEYPKAICEYQGMPIIAGFGRFGPYLLYDKIFYSLKGNPMELDEASCVELLEKAKLQKSKNPKSRKKDEIGVNKTKSKKKINQ